MGFREKLIIFGVLPWVIAILLLLFLVLPSISGIQVKSSTLHDKESELSTLEDSIKKQKDVSKIVEEISNLESSLKGFNLQFPADDDLEKLYVDIQTAINDTGLLLEKLSVSKEKSVKFSKDFFEKLDETTKEDSKDKDKKKKKKKKAKKKKGKTIPPATMIQRSFKLEVVGSYQGIVDLVNYLNTYYRFITLENISVKENMKAKMLSINNPSNKILNASIIFSVYRYRKNEVPVETETKKKKKK